MLDTTAFLARWPLYAPPGSRLYTTSLVLGEVRDRESRSGLELALTASRVQVLDPPPGLVREAERLAARHGLHTVLSGTDLSVAALALLLREEGEVVVVTDDYALQNLVALAGLRFMPLRTRGIVRAESYIAVCPACGYRSTRPGERVCPVCGTPLVRRSRRRRGREKGRGRT